MAPLGRFLERVRKTDEELLAEELRSWVQGLPGVVPIEEAPRRKRTRVAGVVRRITVQPIEGFQALDVVLYDGTGVVTARWLGRQNIPGLALGSRLVVEGVIGRDQDVLRMVNPTFEFV